MTSRSGNLVPCSNSTFMPSRTSSKTYRSLDMSMPAATSASAASSVVNILLSGEVEQVPRRTFAGLSISHHPRSRPALTRGERPIPPGFTTHTRNGLPDCPTALNTCRHVQVGWMPCRVVGLQKLKDLGSSERREARAPKGGWRGLRGVKPRSPLGRRYASQRPRCIRAASLC